MLARDGFDAAHAGATPFFADDLEQADVAGARYVVPPHSSRSADVEHAHVSPYFSPNSHRAGLLRLSMSSTRLRRRRCDISALTGASISAICSASPARCAEVEARACRRHRPASPFAGHAASTSRSALCIRWWRLWLRIVAAARRVDVGDHLCRRASARLPTCRAVVTVHVGLGFCVSSTANAAAGFHPAPRSPTWPPLSA